MNMNILDLLIKMFLPTSYFLTEGKDNAFFSSPTISNITIKYVNKKIIYIDTTIQSKKVEGLKMELVIDTKYGTTSKQH